MIVVETPVKIIIGMNMDEMEFWLGKIEDRNNRLSFLQSVQKWSQEKMVEHFKEGKNYIALTEIRSGGISHV